MKVKEKRKVRGYKITDKRYKAAQRRAKKDDIPLATYIEMFVTLLGSGTADIAIKDRGWLPLKSMAGDFMAGRISSKEYASAEINPHKVK
jgi:hypothetical protein